jgi:hypothetical protein
MYVRTHDRYFELVPCLYVQQLTSGTCTDWTDSMYHMIGHRSYRQYRYEVWIQTVLIRN